VVPAGEVATIDLDSMESDKLVAFTLACKTVDDFSGKARDILKERAMKPGVKIPGVSVVSKRGSRTIPAVELLPVAKDLLPLLGNVSEAKALEAWGDGVEVPDPESVQLGGLKMITLPFPSDKVVESGGSTYIMVKPVKAKKA
jgi:hypothetical protein